MSYPSQFTPAEPVKLHPSGLGLISPRTEAPGTRVGSPLNLHPWLIACFRMPAINVLWKWIVHSLPRWSIPVWPITDNGVWRSETCTVDGHPKICCQATWLVVSRFFPFSLSLCIPFPCILFNSFSFNPSFYFVLLFFSFSRSCSLSPSLFVPACLSVSLFLSSTPLYSLRIFLIYCSSQNSPSFYVT